MSLEFGTIPKLEVFKALRAENWHHHYGGKSHPKAKAIKECSLRAFYPDSEKWRAKVWDQGEEVVDAALRWLEK